VVVELVGPAGVGKTTLAHNIQRANSRVHVGLSLWQVPAARLVQGAVALVPTIIVSALRKRRLRWREIRHMIRLDALRHAVRPERGAARGKRKHIIMLDEGPVFGIGWLDVAFAERGVEAPVRWRRRVVRRWAELLDSVVLLDAGDRVLASRIRTRFKRHRMKRSSDAALRRFAGVFRKAYDAVIAELSSSGAVAVQVARTDGSLPRSAARVNALLERHRDGH
jgi:hypothetical protein